MSRKEIEIWLLFLLMNSLLFLPRYLMELDTSTFFPYKGFLENDWHSRYQYFFNRTNYDIFRFNVDFAILVIGRWYFNGYFLNRYFGVIPAIGYILIFFYLIYYTLFSKIYLTEPLFYSDFHMISLGFFNTIGSPWILIPVILVLAAFVFLLFKLITFLINRVSFTPMGKASRIITLIIFALFLLNSIRSGFTFNAHHTFQFTTAEIIRNIKSSLQVSHQLKEFSVKDYPYHYHKYTLVKRPNIFLIFIESYGKIVYDNPAIFKTYFKVIGQCEQQLDSYGWHAASHFSTSPVSGGGSWRSYSTVMYGFNIKDEVAYLSLLKRSDIVQCEQMMQFFHLKGYRNYRLNAIPENEKMKIRWDLYTRFYGVDEWIYFRQMNYKGELYGFGPSPPDQFSLAFARQHIQQQGEEPFTLFFITQSSHTPFISPKNVETNWKSLNTGKIQKKQESAFLRKPTVDDYTNAIRYQMLMITNFIVRFGKENDIFIIIGDHQPPLITSGKEYGFETPVHIISKDIDFISKFKEDGFESGLFIKNKINPIKHAGIYSLFMHVFLSSYGDNQDIPPWLPNGAFSEYSGTR